MYFIIISHVRIPSPNLPKSTMSLPGVRNPPADPEKQFSPSDSKDASNSAQIESAQHDSESNFGVLDTELDIATHIVSVRDDPTLNPWTLRAFIVGLGLSAFEVSHAPFFRLVIQL